MYEYAWRTERFCACWALQTLAGTLPDRPDRDAPSETAWIYRWREAGREYRFAFERGPIAGAPPRASRAGVDELEIVAVAATWPSGAPEPAPGDTSVLYGVARDGAAWIDLARPEPGFSLLWGTPRFERMLKALGPVGLDTSAAIPSAAADLPRVSAHP